MKEEFLKKAYLAFFKLIDAQYDQSKNEGLAVLLGDMIPDLYSDGISADPACYEDFCACLLEQKDYNEESAFNGAIAFLRKYCEQLGFNMLGIIENISFEKYQYFLNENELL